MATLEQLLRGSMKTDGHIKVDVYYIQKYTWNGSGGLYSLHFTWAILIIVTVFAPCTTTILSQNKSF